MRGETMRGEAARGEAARGEAMSNEKRGCERRGTGTPDRDRERGGEWVCCEVCNTALYYVGSINTRLRTKNKFVKPPFRATFKEQRIGKLLSVTEQRSYAGE